MPTALLIGGPAAGRLVATDGAVYRVPVIASPRAGYRADETDPVPCDVVDYHRDFWTPYVARVTERYYRNRDEHLARLLIETGTEMLARSFGR